MAALSGRLRYVKLPWGLAVSVTDLAENYTLRDGYVRVDCVVHYIPNEVKNGN
jgi:hypothetical protein